MCIYRIGCGVCVYMYSFFLGKVTALGVLCCFALFVCLTLLASFFLPSHLSFKNMYIGRASGVSWGWYDKCAARAYCKVQAKPMLYVGS